jgi:hypothetical protein
MWGYVWEPMAGSCTHGDKTNKFRKRRDSTRRATISFSKAESAQQSWLHRNYIKRTAGTMIHQRFKFVRCINADTDGIFQWKFQVCTAVLCSGLSRCHQLKSGKEQFWYLENTTEANNTRKYIHLFQQGTNMEGNADWSLVTRVRAFT